MELINTIYPSLLDAFKGHLNTNNNHRLIFSGHFGAGKTSFLNEFFSLHINEYEKVLISPVNYTVSPNEDIFKFIQYDILLELMSRGVTFEGIDLEDSQYLYLYIQRNWKKIGSNLISKLSILGKYVFGLDISIIENTLNFFNDENQKLIKFKNSLESKTPNEIVERFFEEISEINPNFFEDNAIQKLIKNRINNIGEKKQKVLIIDDLDRIDPEHIFRILNCLSSSLKLDNHSIENIYGFTKIILVCDIKNLQSIYAHKYGNSVEFDGYIAKFYSHSIFKFDISLSLRKDLTKFLNRISIPLEESLHAKYLYNETKPFLKICKILIEKNLIRIRTFAKYFESDITQRSINISGKHHDIFSHDSLWQFVILCKLIGSSERVNEIFSELSEYDYAKEFHLFESFSFFLEIATIYQHNLTEARQHSYRLVENDLESLITYEYKSKTTDAKLRITEFEFSYINNHSGIKEKSAEKYFSVVALKAFLNVCKLLNI